MNKLFYTVIYNDKKFLISTLIALLISLTKAQFRLNGIVLSDSFHYGEYFSTLTTLMHGDFYPFSIHGGLDYIPGFISLKIFDENSYFFHTWLFHRVLDILPIFVFLSIIHLLTKTNDKNTHFLISAAIISPFIFSARDLFLLVSIYLFFLIQRENSFNKRLVYEFIFGLSISVSLFWTFDKGIATVISLGLPSIIYVYRDRVYILSLVVFFIIITLLHYLVPTAFSMINYYENIKFLINTSYQWNYGFQLTPILLTIYITTYVILSLWLYTQSILNSKEPRANIENSILFIILSLFIFKIAVNRADLYHILMAIWTPLLSLFYLQYNRIDLKINIYLKYSLNVFLLISLLIAIKYTLIHNLVFIVFVLLSIGIFFINYPKTRLFIKSKLLPLTYISIIILTLSIIFININKNKYNWVMKINSPQNNSKSVTDGIRWVSQELIEKKANCVFDLSNNGVINGLTKLPSCTKFSYIVYADYHYEQQIIDSLKNNFPPAIVYSSTFWSFDIDGRSMHERFPILNEFILSNYPYEKCKYGYCIRYLDIINKH